MYFMFDSKYEEHLAHSEPCSSRWDGFDRGDADFDYEEARLADNEAFEEQMKLEAMMHTEVII